MDIAPYLEQPKRVVKPRGRVYVRRPVIVLHEDTVLTEQGEIGTTEGLVKELRAYGPTLFACVGAADLLSHLDSIFAPLHPELWQWRVTSNERAIVRPDGTKAATRISTLVHYFGWKNGNYHKLIDPVTMYGNGLDEVYPDGDSPLEALLGWAVTLRDFCDNEGIEVRPTIGAIASQFLTDRRFYPNARRKVPAKTNEQVREHLPGNYYFLNVMPGADRHEYTAHYLDQHRAHHYHARTTRLPDADHLYAFGRFVDLSTCVFSGPWEHFYGLYCLDLQRSVSARRGNDSANGTGNVVGLRAFQWLRGNHAEPELTKQFVYSNELRHLEHMGYTITGIRAAWGSRKQDTGLAKYSQWAEEQLDSHNDAPWLKPLLLSAYGVLATKPRQAESVFRMAAKGELVTVLTGALQLEGKLTQGTRKLEPRIANVLHRGMIEAATRSDSVGLAQFLNSQGHQILSIYADAVIVAVDEDKPLPTIPEPWRLKRTLNHLQFVNQQAFISGEMTKLPGVSQELRKFGQASHGRAPRTLIMTEAVSGRKIRTHMNNRSKRNGNV